MTTSVADPSRPAALSERAERGRAVRAAVPRRVHGDWAPASDRPDPVAILEQESQTRVAELVPIRYGRMASSPFAFFRGAAAIMAADLAHAPRTGLQVQLCGDAHLSNFGIFATPDRRLTFDVDDFDETLPGPFEWDVERLAASFAVAGRERGFEPKLRAELCAVAVGSYRRSLRDFAALRTLDLWYARLDVDRVARMFRKQARATDRRLLARGIEKARTRDSLRAFAKLTHLVDGEPRIAPDRPLVVPLDEFAGPDGRAGAVEGVHRLIREYGRTLPADRRELLERFRFVDAARKVVGVGSVGTRTSIVLMLGRDEDDPLFLQAKEAEPSVLEPYLGGSAYANSGQRVVEGQRLMQAASDIFLGWFRDRGADGVERDYYVRQLWDQKGSAEIEAMTPSLLFEYARLCGWTLAKAHARSGDPVAIASYLGDGEAFDSALARFAEAYADQNERDHAAFRQAIADGRLDAAFDR